MIKKSRREKNSGIAGGSVRSEREQQVRESNRPEREQTEPKKKARARERGS